MLSPRDIWPDLKTLPPWLPAKIPDKLGKVLAHFTPHRDGFVRWYADDNRFVCGKTTPLDQVEERWTKKKAAIDAARTQPQPAVAVSGYTLKQVVSFFYEFNDNRVRNGKPKRMSPVTALDYQKALNAFGACVGPETPMAHLGPNDFGKYAAELAELSMSRFATQVAYVEAFVRWALQRGYLADSLVLRGLTPGMDAVRALVGPDLVKPPKEDLRDERIDAEKSYEAAQLRALWRVADAEEKIWMGLGLAGALDNADLAHLQRPCVDLEEGVIDFRRRKRGKVRRLIPIPPELLELLKAYRRPEPAKPEYADLFFLTPTGLPLQRVKADQIDSVALRWQRMMVRAGLRKRPTVLRFCRNCGKPRETPRKPCECGCFTWKKKQKAAGDADGRGFRGLRTTFANLAPAGYREEVEIVMGHAQGTVLLDNYLEKFGTERIVQCVNHVWHRALTCPQSQGEECRCGSGPRPVSSPEPAAA